MSSCAAFSKSVLHLAITAAILPTTVFADQQGDDLNTMTIYSDTYRNTGSKSALEPEQTPQGITVIDRQSLDQRGADSINEALRYVPAVNTELRGGAVSRMDQFNIRGFSNSTNFYDGLALLFNDWNLQPQIDAAAVQQIEIFKGPTSVLYGHMPPGGMVNIIGKQPSAIDKTQLELSVGTANLRSATINSQGKLANNDDLTYTLTAHAKDENSQAVTSEARRYLIAGSVDWQATPDTLLNFNLYHQQDPSAGIYNALPSKGTVFSNINGDLPTTSYAGDANWNEYDRDVTIVGYKINHNINDNWNFLQNVKVMDASASQKNTYSTGLAADEKTLSRRAYSTDETSQSFAIDNQLSAVFDIGDVEHNLLIGLDFSKLSSSIEYEDIATSSIDLYNPDHYMIDANMDISNSAYSSDFDITKKQTGIYLQDQMIINDLTIIAGLRYDDFKSTEKGKKYNADTDTQLKQNELSGRIGAMYNFDNGISPFISYAQSFEPVSGSDRLGNEFVPATADQFEIGLKYNPLETDTSLTLSAFRIVKDDVITRDPNGSAYDKIQAGEVTSQGLELALKQGLTDNLSLDFNATIMDMQFTKDSDLKGKTPVWVAEKTASMWLNYKLATTGVNSQLGLGVRYVGETQLDALNTDTVPGYTLVDLSYTTDLGHFSKSLQTASLNVSVSNLFDKRYSACYDADNCWFGAQRSIQAKFKYAF
jgi:iron complex outermembrane receptor protein